MVVGPGYCIQAASFVPQAITSVIFDAFIPALEDDLNYGCVSSKDPKIEPKIDKRFLQQYCISRRTVDK
jgi:hypothetical protein